jgi:protein-S-isoprenylcysteine O-methyltransferase Ste14
MFILSCITVCISLITLRAVRKRFSHEILKENHEVAGFIYNAFGLIFGVLIAFMVFVSWTDHSDARKNVEREANLIVDLFSYSKGLPDTMCTNIRKKLIEYTRSVAEDEWETMEYGKPSQEAKERIAELWSLYFSAEEKSLPNQTAYQESLNRLNELGEYRRMRIFGSRDVIPPSLWFVLLFCSLCSVSFTFFFGVRNIKAQSVMTSVLAIVNTFLLYIIYVLDHPFRGYGKVSNHAITSTLHLIQQMSGY